MEILTTTVKNPISLLLISTFKPYSGDLLMQKKNITSSKDRHLSSVDSASLMKKEPQIEVVGDPLTELQTKKKTLKPHSNLEVTLEETPQIQTSRSPLIETPKKKNPNLQLSPNSSPPTSVNHPSNPALWLEQWQIGRASGRERVFALV